MDQITEPQMLVPCADMVELIEAWEKLNRNFSLMTSQRWRYQYQKASKKLASYNRKTLSN